MKPRLEDCHRLIRLATDAPHRICDAGGQWGRMVSAEAVRLSPEPIPDHDEALHLQHALRDGLIAVKDLPPGTRAQVARGLHGLAMGLVNLLHPLGLSPANVPVPKTFRDPPEPHAIRYNPGVDG